MQRLAYLVVITALAAALAGCGESAETKAADEIRAQVDVARRHFVRAAGLVSVSLAVKTEVDASGALTAAIGPMGRGNPAALAALADAEKVLTSALSANSAATGAGKVPANTMLAEVRLAIAAYHGMLARERSALASELLGKIRIEAARAQTLAALDAAMKDLKARTMAVDGGAMAAAMAFSESSEARRALALAKVKELTATRDDLDRQIAEAVAATETKRRTASDLRRQNRTAMGLPKLDLDEKASAVEAEVEAGEAQISDLQLGAAQAVAQLELAQSELDAATKASMALSEFIAGLTGRGQSVQQYRAKLADDLKKAEATLATLAAEVATRFDDVVAEFRSGLAACDRAEKANNQASRALTDLGKEAQAIKRDSPNSPMAPLLSTMIPASNKGRLSGVTARKGDIAFSRGELARQLIASQKNIELVAVDVAGMCQSSGIAAPAPQKTAASSVAGLTALETNADTDYETARVAFERVADRMLASSPVNTRGTKWLYQQAKARALLGRYRLLALVGRGAAGRPYLDQARDLVDTLMAGHEGDTKYLPVKQIRAAIRRAIRAEG